MVRTALWALKTWFVTTLALLVGCVLAWWLAGKGWATLAAIGSGVIEWWLIGALAREVRFEGELRWWWPL